MASHVEEVLDTPVSRFDCLAPDETELLSELAFLEGSAIVGADGRVSPLGSFGWLGGGPSRARWLPDGRLEYERSAALSREARITRTEPADDIESRLIAIWRRVLGTNELSPESNFFDVGGYSVRVVELFRAINREFGTSIPFTELFRSPSVRELAGVVRDRALQAYSCLVNVQPQGTRPPLFLVQSYLLYESLPRAFGSDQPVYGLLEPPVEHRKAPYRLEDIARLYAGAIRRVEPEGPYYVAGWCAAGTLTLEVARLLELDGGKIGMLGLIDAWCPVRPPDATATAPHRTSRDPSGWLTAKMRQLRDRARTTIWRRAAAPWLNRGLPLPRWLWNASELTLESMRRFRPKPVSCPITVFRAEVEDFKPYDDPWCGWKPWTASFVELVPVPGSHLSMFRDPHLAVTAARIRGRIDIGRN